MVYLAAWLRKSNVTTEAEWILFRLDRKKGEKRSHTIIVVFAILSTNAPTELFRSQFRGVKKHCLASKQEPQKCPVEYLNLRPLKKLYL